MMNKLDHDPKPIMIEDGDGDRYEYYGSPVYSGFGSFSKVAYYEPTIKWCHKFATGSTCTFQRVTVEYGREHFREMLAKGFKVVTERSFA